MEGDQFGDVGGEGGHHAAPSGTTRLVYAA
jgi:hypothetical protein